MMTGPSHGQSRDISFQVPYVFRMRFTTDVLGREEEENVLLDLLEPSGQRPPRVQVWLDENLVLASPELPERIEAFCQRHLARIERVSAIQIVPGGEAIKNDIHVLERMLKVMHAADLDRHSYVVAIGGGAVLDTVGFAAAIAHRGIRLVRLPTTTLAQSDSGIGVKNSVNLFHKKNWLGTFAVPWGVINDATLLLTLSDRDFRCGFAEAVKVALLKSPVMFERLEETAEAIGRRDSRAAADMIRWSAELHLDHITQGGDPFEAKEARPLDFGHWSAHRLEAMTDFEIRHGEAVAIGVAVDTVYSSLVHGLPAVDARRVLSCLRRLGFHLDHPAMHERQEVFRGLEEFRQHLGGRLTLTMLTRIGQAVEVHDVDHARMHVAMGQVAEFAHSAVGRSAASGR
ncbi:MAG: 3-dehydroquinate synthase [Pirellulaceae bacterium]